MKTATYHSETVRKLIEKQKVATLSEIKSALGTDVSMTASRKLKELSCINSYSHRGKYYTLARLAYFDRLGLWSFNKIEFSKYGTLLETAGVFVERSEDGYSARELEKILNVAVKEPLLRLVRDKKIYRRKESGRYIYYSLNLKDREKQINNRVKGESRTGDRGNSVKKKLESDRIRKLSVLFFNSLDEKRRRLYAGLESLRRGYGGDSEVAEWFSIDNHTVAKGRKELISGNIETDRVRRRKTTEHAPLKLSGNEKKQGRQ